jgi:hypothetical protein
MVLTHDNINSSTVTGYIQLLTRWLALQVNFVEGIIVVTGIVEYIGTGLSHYPVRISDLRVQSELQVTRFGGQTSLSVHEGLAFLVSSSADVSNPVGQVSIE